MVQKLDDRRISFKILAEITVVWELPWWLDGKESSRNAGDQVRSLGWEDPLEKEMATHSSVLAWEIPWTEEPGVL